MEEINNNLIAILFMASLGLMLAGVLVIANKRLFVYDDPRISEIEALLPGANCGACGSPGCRTFAEGVISHKFEPSQCTVNDKASIQAIADYLGIAAGQSNRRVARLACAGGTHIAFIRASYIGSKSCRGAALVSGGGKGCTWGCLGMGDCRQVCDFGAITINKHGLPVIDENKCTACGKCVDICPKKLFEIQPVEHQLFIACRNLEKGDKPEAECAAMCTACKRCVNDAPQGLISIHNNLATINYSKNNLASSNAIERCPTGAIVWFDSRGNKTKSRVSNKNIRKEALPIG